MVGYQPEALEAPQGGRPARGSRLPAWRDFEALARTYRRDFVVWIHTAKRPETRARRIRQSIELLSAGKKLGLK